MDVAWSRRAFLRSIPPLATFGSISAAVHRYRDQATEFDVTRLTSPTYKSYLIQAHLHSVSRANWMLYCSDQSGDTQVWKLDGKSGETHQLTEAGQLRRCSTALLPDERSFCYVDHSALIIRSLAGPRQRDLYHFESGWEFADAITISEDGQYAAVVERRVDEHRIRLIPLNQGHPSTSIQANDPITAIMVRPRRAGLLYRRGGAFWLTGFDGRGNRRLKTPAGLLGPALWSSDGKTVLYLLFSPEDTRRANELREITPDTDEDRLVARTSQFVNFARNGDGSVFLGVSGNRASAYVLLLLRKTRREMTLCEHRASDPKEVTILFSPSSQRFFFQSDWEGHSAIYSMAVERFVEKTEL